MNGIRHKQHYDRNDIPVKELVDSIQNSVEGYNGLLVVCTNGVISRNLNEPQKVRSVTCLLEDQTVASAIYNQAVQFNHHDHMIDFCQRLRKIADLAEFNIRETMKKQTRQN